MGRFFSRLRYSIGNEDWKTEHEALKIQPTDSVLTVTASGDRPLNLLYADCQEMTTIDANPIQNALFDLKKAALGQLDYDHYIAFLGLKDHPNRWATYQTLEPYLTDVATTYWRQHPKKVQRGVLYQGAVEVWTKRASNLIQKIRGKKVDTLFSFDNLEDQRQFLETQWLTKGWKATFDLCLHPSITRLFLDDPGLYAHVDPSIHVGPHLYNRINHALRHFSAKESIIISLLLQGKVYQEAYGPYLTEEGVATLKPRLDRVRMKTANILSLLEESPENSYDCFSLSDVVSYLSVKEFEQVLRGMIRTAKPGARFCLRQFMSRYRFPKELEANFQRDTALEEKLENEDRCFLYKFMVGTIAK